MIARAPGKLVISGAYAVLHGAPAIVTAVDRYVTADPNRSASFVTPEVREALGDGPAPWFDAQALREQDRKLGLGSSAAILVASLAGLELLARGPTKDDDLCAAILSRALSAHAKAQKGGSGIDVAASAYGGTLVVRRKNELLEVSRLHLPRSMHMEIWASSEPASTPLLLRMVHALAVADRRRHADLMGAQARASEQAADALGRSDLAGLIEALARQSHALLKLGEAAGASIITPAVCELSERARREDAAVLPSGAGGGDIALFVGQHAPSAGWSERAIELGHRRLVVGVEARGVHAAQ